MDEPLLCDSQQAWEKWLREHHASSSGMSLKIAKKGSGVKTVSHAEALDVALCFGWIDNQRLPLDGTYFLQKFGPRRARSVWSKINTEKAEALIAAGRMQPAGLREVEAAKADGRSAAAYSSQRSAALPEDFLAELERNPEAKAFFETLNSANRYAILFRIQTAKKAGTRARRIEQFIGMLERHEKIHP